MSRIDDLIAEHCPGGVPYVRVEEAFNTLATPRGIKRSDYSLGTTIPIVDQGQSLVAGYTDDESRKIAEGQYVVFGDHTRAVKWIDFAFAVGADGTKVLSAARRILPKYAYYAMVNLDIMDRGYNRHWTIVRDLRIPVPPLEVQREIVRVLDQFTQLEAELEAELQARRRQYEHYRHLELTFDSTVPRVALGDIAEVRSGWGFPNSYQGRSEGRYPFYKVSDMNRLGNETVMDGASNYVSEEVAKQLGVRPAPQGTVIFPKIGAAVATNKKRLLSRASAYDNNVMGVIPSEVIESRFLYHWLQTYDLRKLANDSGAVPSIRKSEAEKLLVPLPHIEEQRRIVALLDKFDALANDLQDGLPGEINSRRKQYEHYRDKLLTFEEAVA